MGTALAKSGLFGMKTPEQAIALMLVAQAEGQHPATIAQDYDVIQGKATRKTHSVLARFQAAGGKVEWHELSHTKADATFSHPAGGSVRLDWTIEQAKQAKLAGKDNWVGYARAMLRARVIAEGVRATYPAALGGMMVSEEAQDLGPADGPAPAPAPAPAVKHMGDAVEVPPWSDDLFASRLPEWRKAIAENRATADAVIAKAQTKHPLTEAQKSAIRAPITSAPAMTSGQVSQAMADATDVDSLNEAAALIDAVTNEAARKELNAEYDACLSKLTD